MRKLIAAIIGAGLVAYLLFEDRKPSIREVAEQVNSSNSKSIDEDALMNKLLEDIR
jgi:hypothetical protein